MLQDHMMETPQFRRLFLPASTSSGDTSVESSGSIVIIGANGSGKTRIGAWIEFDSQQKELVHRVSAQKSLRMPNSNSPKAVDEAEAELLYGHLEALKRGNPIVYKKGHRWRDKPVLHPLDDFGWLMVYLFSDHYEKCSSYLEASKLSTERVRPPETKLDVIKRIWENVLPHRELVVRGAKVETRVKLQPASSYDAAEMSDGERVIFYLAGQCLAAPEHGIIVIDEPEMHLHRSIQTTLWNQLELERPDCSFIYLTHDLEFAASRVNSKKVWLKAFDGSAWDWAIVPDVSGVPEEILLSVLGSRRPVLFVEGDKDSLDNYFFAHLYPNYLVTPCGSCSQVISATRSFSDLPSLHTIKCFGIIDRDFRTASEVDALEKKGVFALDVSEIENLLLTEDVMRVIAEEMVLDDVDRRIQDAKTIIISELEAEQDQLTLDLARRELESILAQFSRKADSMWSLKDSYVNLISSINIDQVIQSTSARVQRVIKDSEYEQALMLFNHKGLVFKIAHCFDMDGNQYRNYVKRLVASKKGEKLRQVMSKLIPTLPANGNTVEAA